VFKVLTLNNIAKVGLSRFPADGYQIGNEVADPDAILVRSADMHGAEIARSLKAVGRAGAGVNNIPVAKMSERGIPVFNAPVANANAVKELVIAGLVLACRQICSAWDFARRLEGSDEAITGRRGRQEKFALALGTLGVIGLGATAAWWRTPAWLWHARRGVRSGLTVEGAWQLGVGRRRGRSTNCSVRPTS
jgi:D-3-phosphoglycerate dehydrogenase